MRVGDVPMPIVKQITKEMIDAIKVERQQVAKEIDRLFDKLAALEATLETYGVKALRPRAKRPPVAIAHSTNATDTAQYQGLTQIEAAYRLLVELGRPLHVDNIAFGLIQRGVKLRGDISNLS